MSKRECVTHHYACDCREEKFIMLEAENAKLKEWLVKERECVDFYGSHNTWNTSGFSLDHVTEHKCKISFEIDGERTSDAFIKGGKRARQRQKERDQSILNGDKE